MLHIYVCSICEIVVLSTGGIAVESGSGEKLIFQGIDKIYTAINYAEKALSFYIPNNY